MVLKKKDPQQKENEAKIKEKQKKLKEMRLHQAPQTPFVQPTVDQALLAAAIAQAQAMGGAAVNPVFVDPVGTGTNFNLNHLLNPLHMRLRGSVMKQPKFSGHPNYWASFERHAGLEIGSAIPHAIHRESNGDSHALGSQRSPCYLAW